MEARGGEGGKGRGARRGGERVLDRRGSHGRVRAAVCQPFCPSLAARQGDIDEYVVKATEPFYQKLGRLDRLVVARSVQ